MIEILLIIIIMCLSETIRIIIFWTVGIILVLCLISAIIKGIGCLFDYLYQIISENIKVILISFCIINIICLPFLFSEDIVAKTFTTYLFGFIIFLIYKQYKNRDI